MLEYKTKLTMQQTKIVFFRSMKNIKFSLKIMISTTKKI